MPQTPSEPTSSNKATRKKLDPFLRGVIFSRYLGGEKNIDIQRATGLPYSTINATIEKYRKSTTGASDPCYRRPKALTQSNKEFIHFLIK